MACARAAGGVRLPPSGRRFEGDGYAWTEERAFPGAPSTRGLMCTPPTSPRHCLLPLPPRPRVSDPCAGEAPGTQRGHFG